MKRGVLSKNEVKILQATKLVARGKHSYGAISKIVGVSIATIREWTDEEYYQRRLESKRAAKAKMKKKAIKAQKKAAKMAGK